MVILDTSFLVSYFRECDIHHREAVEIAQDQIGEKMIISFLVFQELMNILNRKGTTELALTIAGLLLSKNNNFEIYKMDEGNFSSVMKLFSKLKPHTLSYIDISLIHLSRELELPVLTFDKELQKALA